MNQKKIVPTELNFSLGWLGKSSLRKQKFSNYVRGGKSKTSRYLIEKYPVPDKRNRKYKWSVLRTSVSGLRSTWKPVQLRSDEPRRR